MILNFLTGIIDKMFAVAGAFAGSQLPSFMQQYSQRLSGHIEEIGLQIQAWRQIASLSGKTLAEYVQKFQASKDPDFSRQGEFMQSLLARFDHLSQAQEALNSSGTLERPFIFLSHLQSEIFQTTFQSFIPQVTLTIEGILYALAGVFIGHLSYRLLAKIPAKVLYFKKQYRTGR